MNRQICGLATGLVLAVSLAAYAGAALADNGKGPPSAPPGNSGNAPGQGKKDQAAPAPPAAAAAGPVANGPQAGSKPEKPGKPAKPAKPEKPQATSSSVRTADTNGSSGNEKTAHDKVLICHATGSATNPFVVISISVNAWSKGSGHGAHEDDVFIDFSFPGDPRQKDESLCPGARAVAASTTTASTTLSTTTTSTTTATTAGSVPSGPAGPAPGGVAGAAAAIGQGADQPLGGVLGAFGQLGQTAKGRLPFTGFPLWGVAFAALGLIGLGLVVRRRIARQAV